jgi:predicted DNA-binding protein
VTLLLRRRSERTTANGDAPATRDKEQAIGRTMYRSYIVRRTQIYLDDQQDRRLAERSRQVGRTKSALIRDAVDAYLSPASRDDEALARLRAAVTMAAGAARHLPAGADYVDELRAIEAERQRAHDRRR